MRAAGIREDYVDYLTHKASSEDRLQALRSGVQGADGFALNVSNFFTTEANLAYGDALSAQVGGKHFVVDTSRNEIGRAHV